MSIASNELPYVVMVMDAFRMVLLTGNASHGLRLWLPLEFLGAPQYGSRQPTFLNLGVGAQMFTDKQ